MNKVEGDVNKLKLDQRRAALMQLPEYDKDFKSKFSGKLLEKYHAALTSDDIVEFDLIDLNGEVNKDDMLLYLTFLPEYFNFQRKISQIEEEIFEFFKKPLNGAMKQFIQTGHPGVFVEFYSAISRLVMRYADIINKNPGCVFRASELRNFHMVMISKLNIELAKLFEASQTLVPALRAQRYRTIDSFFHQMCDSNFGHLVGLGEYGSAMRIKDFKNSYRGPFLELIRGYLSKSPVELKKEAEAKYQLIVDNFRANDFTDAKVNFGEGKNASRLDIYNMYKILQPGTKHSMLAKFRVNLAPAERHPAVEEEVRFVDMKTHGQQYKHLYFVSDKGVFDFIINPVDSELRLSEVMTLKESFTALEYEALRNVVFDALLEELAKHEKKVVSEKVDQMREENTSELHIALEESLEKPVWTPYQAPAKRVESAVENYKPEVDLYGKKGERVSLKGRKADKALNAICKILGATYRSGSRHNVIIHGSKTFPIPHKHSSSLAPGTLKGILDYFEITPDQFDEAYN